MQNNFQKAIISLEKKNYVFHFNRIYTVDEIRYHVSVRTQGNISYYFMMEEDNGGWYFSDIALLPEWLIDMEKAVENVIKEHIKEG